MDNVKRISEAENTRIKTEISVEVIIEQLGIDRLKLPAELSRVPINKEEAGIKP
ncbi:hypothetical protein [Paenibacillus xanthanilyticus]|uniref:Uncharacterized protein n=1 Tax=Paenibacillus xanthanilyticus TaxID=1783531 RepID=A0ABV8KAZ2_9BACL